MIFYLSRALLTNYTAFYVKYSRLSWRHIESRKVYICWSSPFICSCQGTTQIKIFIVSCTCAIIVCNAILTGNIVISFPFTFCWVRGNYFIPVAVVNNIRDSRFILCFKTFKTFSPRSISKRIRKLW